MPYFKSLRSAACAALCLMGVGVSDLANAGYSFNDLGTPPGHYTAPTIPISNLPHEGYYSATARDINSTGQIVGDVTPYGNNFNTPLGGGAASWSEGVLAVLGTLYGGFSSALAINDPGQIVGYMKKPTSPWYSTATLWDHGEIIDLGLPGELQSWANDINNLGQIVGYTSYSFNGGKAYAAVWNEGVYTDLNSFISESAAASGWRIADAYSINDDGSISIVLYNDATAQAHDGLLTPCDTCLPIDYSQFTNPVPESETYAMLMAGLGVLVAVARRRKQKAA